MQTVHSSKIKNLITKFYYKENHLCFQIILNCDNNEQRLYKEYNDYAAYKAAYNQLLNVKAAEEFVLVEGEEATATHLSFL